MTDYEQAYRDLRAGVEALIERLLRHYDGSPIANRCITCGHVRHNELGYCQNPTCSCSDGTTVGSLASLIRRDVRALLASSAPATASEGATTGCACHDVAHPWDRPAAGVKSSDGDRGLSEDPIPRCPHGAPTWACVDHPDEGQITVERAIEAWEEKGPTSLTVALMAEALYSAQCRLAACTAQLERVERVEWGVSCMLSGNLPHTGKAWKTKREAEESAERLRSIWRSGDAVESAIETIHVVRRTVTEYAPVVGPWEVVGDE